MVMKLVDYDFELSKPLTAGRRTIRVENATPGARAGHREARFGEGADGLRQVGEKMVGKPPGTLHGASAASCRVASSVDLAPGEYGLICFVPDSKDSKGHYRHGMAKGDRVVVASWRLNRYRRWSSAPARRDSRPGTSWPAALACARDPGGPPAGRRLLAPALGFAPAVHSRPLRWARRDALPGAVPFVSHQERDGRLPQGLCLEVQPGADRRAGGPTHPAGQPVFHQREAAGLRGGARGRGRGDLPASQGAPFAAELDSEHRPAPSSDYNLAQLAPGSVLVVGAGNSGSDRDGDGHAGRETWLAGRDVGHVPFRSSTLGRCWCRSSSGSCFTGC